MIFSWTDLINDVDYVSVEPINKVGNGLKILNDELKQLSDTFDENTQEFSSQMSDISQNIEDLNIDKVDKVIGKDLSSNDFSNSDKAKLDNIIGGVMDVKNIDFNSSIYITANYEISPILIEHNCDIYLSGAQENKANIWAFTLIQGSTAYDVSLPAVKWTLDIAPTFSANSTTEIRLYYIGDELRGVWNT